MTLDPTEPVTAGLSVVPAFDWDAFEEALSGELRSALVCLGENPSKQRFYAVALHGVYREEDGLLGLPRLAAAVVEGAPPATGDFWQERFNPSNFRHADLPLHEARLAALEESLTYEAMRDSPEHWKGAETRYFDVLVRIACRLRDAAPSLIAVTEDFICYWYDDEGGPALAARSIPEKVFARLFPKQIEDTEERRSVTAMEPSARARFLVSRFGLFDGITSEEAQRMLLELGEAALDALVEKVADRRHGWTAAMVLGQIGISRSDVIEVLRVRSHEMWSAMALGMLGDDAWLVKQGSQVAIYGLCAPLKAISQGTLASTLSYAPLQAWLDAASDADHAAVEEELAPGSSYVRIGPEDVDEGLRGLGSAHAVIRWHAAAVLGERGLGKAAAARILPALAACLEDAHPIVRRLAVLSISYWRSAKYRSAIEKLRDDSDEVVRKVVRHVLVK